MEHAPINSIRSAFFKAWVEQGSPSVEGARRDALDTAQIVATRRAKAHDSRQLRTKQYGVESRPIRPKHNAIGSARWRNKSSKAMAYSIHTPRKGGCKPSPSGTHCWVVFDLNTDKCRLCGRKAQRKPITPYTLEG